MVSDPSKKSKHVGDGKRPIQLLDTANLDVCLSPKNPSLRKFGKKLNSHGCLFRPWANSLKKGEFFSQPLIQQCWNLGHRLKMDQKQYLWLHQSCVFPAIVFYKGMLSWSWHSLWIHLCPLFSTRYGNSQIVRDYTCLLKKLGRVGVKLRQNVFTCLALMVQVEF